MRHLPLTLGALAALLLPGLATADDRPFVYARDANGPVGLEVQAMYGVSVGSPTSGAVRFADPAMGRAGVVQQLGVQGGFTPWLAAGGYGLVSMGNPSDSPVSGAGGGYVHFTFLRPKEGRNGGTVGLTVDAHGEFGGVFSLAGRLGGGGRIGRFQVGGDLEVEKRFAEGADGVDVMVTLGANVAVIQDRLRLGVEYVGQDLEDLWEEEEAEGGAAHILAPSLTASLLSKRQLQLGVAPGVVLSAQGAGFGGRFTAAWRF